MKRVISVLLMFSVLVTGCNSASLQVEADAAIEVSKPVFVMAGIIDTNEKAQITSKLSAKVAEITVEVGTVVKEGDSLITLDTKDIEAQVAQAEAGVNAARANLMKMQAGARPEQIAQAQSTLDSAQISYINAKNNFERNQQLLSAGAISQAQLETAQTQLAALEAQYNSAQNQLNLLIQGETEESLNVLRAQVAQAEAALELAKTQLTNGTIVSPISGIVSAKNINIGEFASPGVNLISVVNVDTLFIKASLPEGLMGEVKINDEVTVKVAEVEDQEFKGRISVIDPVVDSRSKSVLVRIQVDNHNSLLKPGMLAEIGLIK